MNITLFYFSKKVNSTKQPSTTQQQHKTVSVELKAPCSRLNPIFLLHISNLRLSPDNDNLYYNYLQWGNRYYFIEAYEYSTNDLIEISCKLDTLATYRSAIGNSTQYVTRSASNYNEYIIDTLYPTKAGKVIEAGTISRVPWTATSGYYVIGVTQFNSAPQGAIKRGGVTYFVCTSNQITNMIATMSTEGALTNNVNPLDYISSCVYLPFALTVGTEHSISWQIAGNTIVLQYYDFPVSSGLWTDSFTIHPPIHPLYTTRGKYVAYAPFTKYTLYTGVFGEIEIPTELLSDVKVIYADIRVDLPTGEAVLSLYNNNGSEGVTTPIIARTKAVVSVPIKLSQLSSGNTWENRLAVAGAGVQAIASIATAQPVGLNFAVQNAISSSIDLLTPRLHTTGGNGSFADIRSSINIIGEFAIPVDDNIEDYGRPLCERVQINTLSGFILCADAELNTQSTDTETQEIVNYLNNGFFYE